MPNRDQVCFLHSVIIQSKSRHFVKRPGDRVLLLYEIVLEQRYSGSASKCRYCLAQQKGTFENIEKSFTYFSFF